MLLCILGMTLVTSGFPQPRLPLRRPDTVEPDDWVVLSPPISRRDWHIQTVSAPHLRGAANSRTGVTKTEWMFDPQRTETRLQSPDVWSQGSAVVRRNMEVADDAAFREKSKLLTSMERQKWLNSYIHKLQVVHSS
ncbi:tuberoinfundibular peptide of 39 residues [Antennarius striatus]|uniref:tuberoinfundibular peptide of 39 residues n=1 Tax=Antennarius striatus TaxID=241820 RepID=UPI0035B1A133